MTERRKFWEWGADGVKRGERSYVPAEYFDAAVMLLRETLGHMVRVTAPADGFTDCVDRIDAFLTQSDAKEN